MKGGEDPIETFRASEAGLKAIFKELCLLFGPLQLSFSHCYRSTDAKNCDLSQSILPLFYIFSAFSC